MADRISKLLKEGATVNKTRYTSLGAKQAATAKANAAAERERVRNEIATRAASHKYLPLSAFTPKELLQEIVEFTETLRSDIGEDERPFKQDMQNVLWTFFKKRNIGTELYFDVKRLINSYNGTGAYYGLGKYVTQKEADKYFEQEMAQWAPPEEEQWGDTWYGKMMTGAIAANRGGEGVAVGMQMDNWDYHAQQHYRDLNRKAIEDEMKGGARHRYSGRRDWRYDEYEHPWYAPWKKGKANPKAWTDETHKQGKGFWQQNKLRGGRNDMSKRLKPVTHGPGPESHDFAYGRGSYRKYRCY